MFLKLYLPDMTKIIGESGENCVNSYTSCHQATRFRRHVYLNFAFLNIFSPLTCVQTRGFRFQSPAWPRVEL